MVDDNLGLLTGAGDGIGCAGAATIAEQAGVGVVLIHISADRYAQTARSASAWMHQRDGAETPVLACDLTDPGTVESPTVAVSERLRALEVRHDNIGLLDTPRGGQRRRARTAQGRRSDANTDRSLSEVSRPT
jgi:NADP-dependent 3-hydroxy acid dehydrogenase YdfG